MGIGQPRLMSASRCFKANCAPPAPLLTDARALRPACLSRRIVAEPVRGFADDVARVLDDSRAARSDHRRHHLLLVLVIRTDQHRDIDQRRLGRILPAASWREAAADESDRMRGDRSCAARPSCRGSERPRRARRPANRVPTPSRSRAKLRAARFRLPACARDGAGQSSTRAAESPCAVRDRRPRSRASSPAAVDPAMKILRPDANVSEPGTNRIFTWSHPLSPLRFWCCR